MMYYVYVLHCANDSLYTGITTDVPRRMRQHLGLVKGGAKYTALHQPKEIAMVWSALDKSAALKMEAAIKALTRKEKDRLIACPALLGVRYCTHLDGALYPPIPDLKLHDCITTQQSK